MRLAIILWLASVFAVPAAQAPLEFIDSNIENGSPVWYDSMQDGAVRVHLLYDHERNSPNRAAGHIHFRVFAKTGAQIALEFINLDNVWNSVPGSIAGELKTMVVSEDGKKWRSIPTKTLPTNRIRLHIEMPGPSLYVARVEPYLLSDLGKFLSVIRSDPNVEIQEIGKTVQGRPLEIVRLGNPQAPYRVFLRARAHPWEPGGNWIVEGLTARFLGTDGARFREQFCVYVLPMANKDGVALGRTRFNMNGKDLNRDWNGPSDRDLAPENFALEQWLQKMIAQKQKPHLALELHNDGNGKLHVSRPPIPDLARHVERMTIFEQLLRKDTWFTEGPTQESFHNAGTLGEGWLQRYGVDAAVHEFNCNWIAGLHDYPSSEHWKDYGRNLCDVFWEYFERVRP